MTTKHTPEYIAACVRACGGMDDPEHGMVETTAMLNRALRARQVAESALKLIAEMHGDGDAAFGRCLDIARNALDIGRPR